MEPVVLPPEAKLDGEMSALWLLPPPRLKSKSFQFLAFGEPKSLSGIFLCEDDLRAFITGEIESDMISESPPRDVVLNGEYSGCNCWCCCTLSSQYVAVGMLEIAAVFCGSANCLP